MFECKQGSCTVPGPQSALLGGGHMPQTDRQPAGEQEAVSQGANLGAGDLRRREDRQKERE